MAQQTNEKAAVVVQEILKQVPDGLAKATPLWEWLSKGGKKEATGGLYLQFPIKLIKNTTQNFISGTSGVVGTTPSVQMQYGVLNWKYHYMSVNFTLEDHTIAQGKNQVVDFFAQKVKGAISDRVRQLSSSVHGTSTSNSFLFEGLQDITAASGTAYAGLTDTDYTDDTTAYLPLITTYATPNYTSLNKMIQGVRARMQTSAFQSDGILGLMNTATYSYFLNSVVNSQRFVNEEAVAKMGFTGFYVNGVNFYLDADVPGTQDGSTADNYIYIFPKEIMQFHSVYGLGKKSPFDEEVRMPTQPIRSIQSFLCGNMACVNRRLVVVNKVFVA
uniref:Putative capsid protein n=1 Tax=viral metagenome TaxID=1070528 RepID=A0A6M3LTK0_9ZZZZ